MNAMGETLSNSQAISPDAAIRKFNFLSLFVLFVGGYVGTVLIAWAVLLIRHAQSPHSTDSLPSILTPAATFLIYSLQPLITPFFASPVLLTIFFSLLSVKTKIKKRPWVIALAAVFLGTNSFALALNFGDRTGTGFNFLASGFFLLVWLSVGFVAVKVSQRTWLKLPVH